MTVFHLDRGDAPRLLRDKIACRLGARRYHQLVIHSPMWRTAQYSGKTAWPDADVDSDLPQAKAGNQERAVARSAFVLLIATGVDSAVFEAALAAMERDMAPNPNAPTTFNAKQTANTQMPEPDEPASSSW